MTYTHIYSHISIDLYLIQNVLIMKFLGILFGVAMRTKKPLDLFLAPPMWKLVAGMKLTVEDLEEVRIFRI